MLRSPYSYFIFMKTSSLPTKIKTIHPLSVFVMCALLIVDGAIWWSLFHNMKVPSLHSYNLSSAKVAKPGDPNLVIFPGGVTVLVNAGANSETSLNLQRVMPQGATYLDAVIITAPVSRYFGGLQTILDHFRVGAFFYNGRDAPDNGSDVSSWAALMARLAAQHIPMITLGAGDCLRYKVNEIDVLAPNNDSARSADIEQAGLELSIR